MQFTADLNDNNEIIVSKKRDISNLYSKNKLGVLESNDKLRLDPLEGLFLLGEGKLNLYKNNRTVDFHSLLKTVNHMVDNADIKYLAYRDLKLRGYKVKIKHDDVIDFIVDKKNKEDKQVCCKAFSELDVVTIKDIESVLSYTSSLNSSLWFMIVDEEGDITYYNISKHDVKTRMEERGLSYRGDGYLIHNRVVVFNPEFSSYLHEEGFYGKPFSGNALQLSIIEAVYLQGKNVLRVYPIEDEREISKEELKRIFKKREHDVDDYLRVFTDLKQRGLTVKTGFKFGSHFRVYTKKPGVAHADYLVHVVSYNYRGVWSEISRAVRLAHSVNKEFILAYTRDDTVGYISIGRLRA